MRKAVTPTPDHEIDLLDLWQTIWSGRWVVAIVTAVCTLAGAAYAMLAQEWFKAEVVLAPAGQQSYTTGSLPALQGLGSLATLAGISLPSQGTQQPVAVLKSKAFAREFIEDQKLVPDLLKEASSSGKPDIRDAV